METIIPTLIEKELKESYLDYSMSVIVGRALPDVRDGLKPVHRRILFAMHQEGLHHDKKFTKCAGVVGSVLKYFHPHGDQSVYDALVRLAQPWALRYPLIFGQGNFGCFTADTKVKLADGRLLSFLELVEEYNHGKKNFTFTVDNGEIKIAEIKHPRLTKKNAEIMKVFLDNGEEIKCTLNHKFMLKTGIYKEAKDLLPGDSLMPLYTRLSTKVDDPNVVGYEMVLQLKSEEWAYTHVLADEWNLATGIYQRSAGRIRHHLDFNKLNNNPFNIQRMDWKKHWQLHYHLTSEKHRTDEGYRIKLADGRKEFWKNEENRKIYSQRMSKRNLENWKNQDYRTLMINNLSEINKKRWEEHPELKQVYSRLASSTLKRLWKNPEYKNLFHEKIVASNKRRETNAMGKKKFLRILAYLQEHNLNFNKDNFEDTRKNVFGTKSFTSWDLGINKYFQNDLNLALCELNKNHKVLRIEFLNETADVYDLTIDKTHNFALAVGVFVHNSIDGDPPAAYRYTESKLSKVADSLLQDIDKETVDFTPNFDGSTKEPLVLPARLPNLLINGSSGIAVGMATNIPPHNMGEIVDALIARINNPDIQLLELLSFIKGPDFPTGGQILGAEGIKQAYRTGKGKITVRSLCSIEEGKIVVTEIPYQLNKSLLLEEIARLVKDKVIEGISDLRDESDRQGMRIVIELKRDANADAVLNQLYKNSPLQGTFGINIIALVHGQPRQLSLLECLNEYLAHRKEVVTRRTQFELRKAEERDHVLQGLLIALDSIDAVIRLIKTSQSVEIARTGLMQQYSLTEIQANAILEMRLSKLAALEQQKLVDEHTELVKTIAELKIVLGSESRVYQIIKDELLTLKNEYADARRTTILDIGTGEIEHEDLIPQEDVVVTLTHSGYIKRIPLDTYKAQRRGGKGIIAAETKDDDFVEHLFITDTHASLLFFTNLGRVHWLKAYQLPDASRYARGSALVNLVKLEDGEKVSAVVPVQTFVPGHYLLMATKEGLVKKTALEEYSRPRQGGVFGITLRDQDRLVTVCLTDGNQQLILATKDGRACRFKESDVRIVGRIGQGVKGINVKDSEVVGMEVCSSPYVLTVTNTGYGKRSEVNDYRLINRGGSGVINIKLTEKNGTVVGIRVVDNSDEALCATKKGVLIRFPLENVSVLGRNTQGVRVMRLDEGDEVVTVTKVFGDADLEGKKSTFVPNEDADGEVNGVEENGDTPVSEMPVASDTPVVEAAESQEVQVDTPVQEIAPEVPVDLQKNKDFTLGRFEQ